LVRRAGAESLPAAPPEGVEVVSVDSRTGERGGWPCAHCVDLPFLTGSAPPEPAGAGGLERAAGWLRRLFR